MPKNVIKRGGEIYPKLLPYGTMIASSWEPEYIELVREVEAQKKFPICGGKKKYRTERPDMPGVCKQPAGSGTDHPGEGRCVRHDSRPHRLTTGRSSMFSNRRLSFKMEEYLQSQEIMDIRNAVAAAWAVLDEVLGENETITPDRAQDVVASLSRIGTLIKQHNDITEGQRLVIEVPQFMAWAEHLYTLALSYIQAAGGDTRGFLSEAQSYYTSAIGSVVGGGFGSPALGPGDSDEAEDVLRPGESPA